jgi:chitodextrinase
LVIDGHSIQGPFTNLSSTQMLQVSGQAQARLVWNGNSQLRFTRFRDNGLDIFGGPGVNSSFTDGGFRGNYDWSTVPSQPSSISPSVSGTSIRVTAGTSGDNGGKNISRYRIQMSVNGGSYGSNRDSRDTTYENLTPGSRYRFRVFATNGNGDSQARISNEITLTSPPTPPGSISVLRNSRNVTVTITASASNGGATIQSYTVQRRSSSDNGVTFGPWEDNQDISSFTFTYQNLAPSLTYQFRAFATNSSGDSGTVNSSNVFIPAGGKRFDAATQQFLPTAIARRFDSNSSQWIDISTAKRFDGNSWQDLS